MLAGGEWNWRGLSAFFGEKFVGKSVLVFEGFHQGEISLESFIYSESRSRETSSLFWKFIENRKRNEAGIPSAMILNEEPPDQPKFPTT
jgi:hypothetical protein